MQSFQHLVSGFLSTGRTFKQRIGEGLFVLYHRMSQVVVLPKTRKSHPISKFLRPWFEHHRLRGVFGLNLVACVLLAGFFGGPVSASSPFASSSSLPEPTLVFSQPVVTATSRRFQLPLATLDVSQGFRQFHPGVDMRSPLGSSIRPITAGVVTGVFQSRFGYGTALVVGHADGYSSLYAHVKRVFVEEGDSVDQETVIAEVGITGTSTGPHLHLEIYKEGKATDPQPLLGY